MLLILMLFLCVILVLMNLRDSAAVAGGGEPSDGVMWPAIEKMLEDYQRDPHVMLTYDDLPKTLPYTQHLSVFEHNPHIGQRKLLMNEIQFFSVCADAKLCIYIGYAPCEHFVVLAEMFPKLKFLLVDPNYPIFDYEKVYVAQNPEVIDRRRVLEDIPKTGTSLQRCSLRLLRKQRLWDGSTRDVISNRAKFDFFTSIPDLLRRKERAFVIQDFMTPELAKRMASDVSREVIFVSDIRTNMFQTSGPTDLDILANDALQHVCIHLIKPAASMLKFHPPYRADDLCRRFKDDDPRDERDAAGFKVFAPMIALFTELFKRNPVEAYLAGEYLAYDAEAVYIQPWAPKGTTEARLVIRGTPALRDYPHDEWEDRFFSYRFMRTASFCSVFKACPEYDGCMDCANEQAILVQYIGSRQGRRLLKAADVESFYTPSLQPEVQRLCQLINSHMTYDLHQRQKFKWHGSKRSPPTEWILYSPQGPMLLKDGVLLKNRK